MGFADPGSCQNGCCLPSKFQCPFPRCKNVGCIVAGIAVCMTQDQSYQLSLSILLLPFMGVLSWQRSNCCSTGLFASLLALSSKEYRGLVAGRNPPKQSWERYIFHNATFLAASSVAIAAGHHLEMPGLKNTGKTFFAAWLVQKWSEISSRFLPVPVTVFASSVAAYYSAVWLRAHPKFLVSLVNSLEQCATQRE